LRNLAIILAVAVLATYAFIAVNERQKEHVIRLRLPKFRKIDKYEFDKALYQVRDVKTRRTTYQAPKDVIQRGASETDSKNDFYKDYDYIENLKNSPSTEAQPIQEASPEQPTDEQVAQQQAAQPQGQEEATPQAGTTLLQQSQLLQQQQLQQQQQQAQQPDQQAPRPVRPVYKYPPQFVPEQQQQ
jgi:FtsZ-interacting cell division protein ZipA